MFAAECIERTDELAIASIDGELDFSIPAHSTSIQDTALSGSLAWRLHGDPELPVVVVLGGISANRNVVTTWCLNEADGYQNLENGWWDEFVGYGLAIDIDCCSVLSFDYIGGNGASSINHSGTDSVNISTYDQAAVLNELLNHLKIKKLKGIVASSYGGMVSLAFSEFFGDRLEKQIVISAAATSHPRSTALRSIQRQVVQLGLSVGDAKQGLALARQLGMVTYRSIDEFEQRFTQVESEKRQGYKLKVENYLQFHGDKFAEIFCPKAFLSLSESIDRHHINPQSISTPTTLISINSDELVFTSQISELEHRIQAETLHIRLDSQFGHDAFLKEYEKLTPIIKSSLESSHE